MQRTSICKTARGLSGLVALVRARFTPRSLGVHALLTLFACLLAPAAAHAQTVRFNGAVSILATANGNFSNPYGVALDANGNVFVADTFNNQVKEILAAGGYVTVNTLAQANGNFSGPFSVAVDANGNVFVADTDNTVVKEILAAGLRHGQHAGAANGNFSFPEAWRWTRTGTSLSPTPTTTQVKEILAAGGYVTVNTLAQANGNFNQPRGVAVDANGNVFVADLDHNAVKEILAAGGYITVNTLAQPTEISLSHRA